VVTHGHYNVHNAMFTYPSLSLRSHGVTIVLYDLQMFLCLTNSDATRVYSLAASETRTSGVLMTFDAILHRLKASDAEMTLGAIFHRPKGSLPNSAQPQLHLGQSSAVSPTFPSEICKGIP
jgi:hypothetical protein